MSAEAALLQLLHARRTIRQFTDELVSADTLNDLRNSMEFAPSAGNSRPWRVVDVSSGEDRAAFDLLFKSAEREFLDTLSNADVAKYRELSLGSISNAPAQWAICVENAPREGRGLGVITMPEALVHSTVCAIHTLTLAAAVRGLGVSWNTTFRPEEVAERFGIPSTWRFVALIGIGRPAKTLSKPFFDDGDWQRSGETPQVYNGFADVAGTRR